MFPTLQPPCKRQTSIQQPQRVRKQDVLPPRRRQRPSTTQQRLSTKDTNLPYNTYIKANRLYPKRITLKHEQTTPLYKKRYPSSKYANPPYTKGKTKEDTISNSNCLLRKMRQHTSNNTNPSKAGIEPTGQGKKRLVVEELPGVTTTLLTTTLTMDTTLPTLTTSRQTRLRLRTSIHYAKRTTSRALAIQLATLSNTPVPRNYSSRTRLSFPTQSYHGTSSGALAGAFNTVICATPNVCRCEIARSTNKQGQTSCSSAIFCLGIVIT